MQFLIVATKVNSARSTVQLTCTRRDDLEDQTKYTFEVPAIIALYLRLYEGTTWTMDSATN